MNSLTSIQYFAVIILPLLFAITLHEVAHGWTAYVFGDPTAKMLGRLSLNPLKHIDPIGSVLVPTVMFFSTGFMFGWAKPVPVNWTLLRHPRRDMALVALAGPMANLGMAILWALVAKLVIVMTGSATNTIGVYFYYAGVSGLFINILLMVLNLIPLPPLDGSKVLLSLLVPKIAYKIARYESYGLLVLAILLISGQLSVILLPPVKWINHFLTSLIIQ